MNQNKAYSPEIKRDSRENGKFNLVYPERGSILDDGSENGKQLDGKALDGTIVGESSQGLTDTGEDSKLVDRRKRPKVDALFSSLFSDASERRV